MKLNCIIVDDEPLARKGLSEYVREIDFLVLVGECANAAQAKDMLTKSTVDLLLLDIQMPHTSVWNFSGRWIILPWSLLLRHSANMRWKAMNLM